MPASSRAHLLLPSSQGLVHYDLLEETAFLGRGKHGLLAMPAPFPEAKLVLADDGDGYVVRALPGEPPPDVNGAPSEGARVKDGDRLRLGDQVALFRTSRILAAPLVAAAAAPAAPKPSPGASTASRPRRATARATPPSGARQGARVLTIIAGALFVFSAYQAARFLQAPRARTPSQVTTAMTQPTEVILPREEQAAEDQLALIERYQADNAGEHNLPDVVARYAGLARSAPDTAAGQRAAAHVAEAWPHMADFVWKGTSLETDAAVRSGKYRRAVAALESFDARFAATEKGALARARLETVRAEARSALDGLRQKIAPLIATDATRAYRILTTSGLEFPADLEAELGAIMARVRESWNAPPAPGEGPGGHDGGGRTGPGSGSKPPGPGEEPGPTPTPGGDHDVEARRIWEKARGDLLGRRWADARRGYGLLLKDWKDAPLVAGHLDRVRAGRKAADYGMRGPAALLTEEATWKDGKLEVEYQFEEDKSFATDFEVEQPFPGEETASAEVRSGMAILSGATAMLLKIVFEPSQVIWEIDSVADQPRDYGLIGFQDGHEYRACAMHVGNTQFRLKKGSAATVLAGHVLWLFGDGVWKDADPGERGFVRIAVKNGNALKPEESVRVRCEITDGTISGEIHAKSETVDLKGPLKGDDGKGMGPLRVGAFAYNGRVGVRRLWVSGKVDMAWAEKQHDALIDAETGPDGK